MVSVVVFEF
ncbi:hypothetical protein VCHC37A1_3212A, partial [Vibrio cholerae HC-37A1]